MSTGSSSVRSSWAEARRTSLPWTSGSTSSSSRQGPLALASSTSATGPRRAACSSAAAAAADGQPVGLGELVRLRERVALVAGEDERILLAAVESGLRRGDDRVHLRLVALRCAQGL